ncbi:hypothetical protein ABRI18_000338 [Vibrio fluvialis]
MMKVEGYEKRFVAFLDILGFSQLISKIEENTCDEGDFSRVKSVLNFLHNESQESNGEHDLPIYEETEDGYIEKELGDPRITYVSDCVIISTEGSIDGYRAICNKITKFSTDIACDGLFLRGAITFGNIYHHGPFLFGTAYQRAYYLEENEVKHPRIIVDDSVFEHLSDYKDTFPLCHPHTVIDEDGKYYLANFPLKYHPQYVFSWGDYLLRVKGKILYHLNKFDEQVSGFGHELKSLDKRYCWKEAYGYNLNFDGGDSRVLKKYLWLKDEFNRTIETHSRWLLADEEAATINPKLTKGKLKISPIKLQAGCWGVEHELGRYR